LKRFGIDYKRFRRDEAAARTYIRVGFGFNATQM
jgi:hypothetical protein